MSLRPLLPLWAMAVVFVPLLAATLGLLLRGWRRPGRPIWGSIRLVLATLLLLTIGLRPSLPDSAAEGRTTDLDVIFAVDVTISMAAEDYDGAQERLVGVRADIEQLVEQLPGSRFSLVTFGGFVYTEVPFTTDGAALMSSASLLRHEFNTISAGSSLQSLNDPLLQLIERAEDTYPERTRVLVVLTDGEQTRDGEESFDLSGLHEHLGAALVLGYGTEQGGAMRQRAPWVPDQSEAPYLTDVRTGEQIISRLDPVALQRLADQLGGQYEQRSAPGPVAGTDALRSVSTQLDSPEEIVGYRDIHWMFAIPLLCLTLLELAVVARRLSAVPRAQPRPRPQPQVRSGA